MNKKISEEVAINELKSASAHDVKFDNDGYQTKTCDADKLVNPSVPEVRR